MNPWQLFWAPQFHFPFGGSVAQRIEPNTNWFFGSIPPRAGDSAIEQKAFETASYGRQLGLITELLLDIAERTQPTTDEGRKAAERLREIKAQIDRLKEQDVDSLVADVESKVTRIKKKSKAKADALTQRLNAKLNEPDA
jgi:hypothetical protein